MTDRRSSTFQNVHSVRSDRKFSHLRIDGCSACFVLGLDAPKAATHWSGGDGVLVSTMQNGCGARIRRQRNAQMSDSTYIIFFTRALRHLLHSLLKLTSFFVSCPENTKYTFVWIPQLVGGNLSKGYYFVVPPADSIPPLNHPTFPR